MRKPRSDDSLAWLPLEQQEQLFAWLHGGMSYRKAAQKLVDDFGAKKPNQECLTRFWRRQCASFIAEQRSRMASMAHSIDGEAKQNPAPFDAATLDSIRVKTLQLMNDPQATAQDVAVLVKLIQKSRDQDIAEAQLDVAKRRLDVLEAKLASVSEAVRKAKQEGGITEETLRRIEEAAKIL